MVMVAMMVYGTTISMCGWGDMVGVWGPGVVVVLLELGRASYLPRQHTGPHAQSGSHVASDQQEPIVNT